jgi:branched-chain amino acid aminotransferase
VNTYINYNGRIIRGDKPIFTADNRSFRYGDGLFETIRVAGDKIILGNFHFERLLAGSRLLGFELPSHFTAENLGRQILDICKKNGQTGLADNHQRVRLVVFRGDGGLYDAQNHFPNYIIQSWPIPASGPPEFNQNGLVIDVFPEGRKSCDAFSNLKSNNYLLYVQAALYAQKHRWNDCLVLNSHERIADSTIANLFYIREEQIYTPPLSEGCVAGVMRRWILGNGRIAGFNILEKTTTIEDLENADEVFLTNSILGIRWVQSFRNSKFTMRIAALLYDSCIKNLY